MRHEINALLAPVYSRIDDGLYVMSVVTFIKIVPFLKKLSNSDEDAVKIAIAQYWEEMMTKLRRDTGPAIEILRTTSAGDIDYGDQISREIYFIQSLSTSMLTEAEKLAVSVYDLFCSLIHGIPDICEHVTMHCDDLLDKIIAAISYRHSLLSGKRP